MGMVNTGVDYFCRATAEERGPCVTVDREPLPVRLVLFVEEREEGPAVFLKDPGREIVHGFAKLSADGTGIFCEDSFHNNIPGDEAERLMTSVLVALSAEEVPSAALETIDEFYTDGRILSRGHEIKLDMEPVMAMLTHAPEMIQEQKFEAVA